MSDNTLPLDAIRREINDADKQMAALFEKRMNAVARVAEYKRINGLPVEDKQREGELIDASAKNISDSEIKEYYISFLKKCISLSKDYQHKKLDGMRVAFSGVPGAFADIAARRIFPDCTSVPYKSFGAAYKACENGDCDCALLPLENSFEGDVAQVMDLTYFGGLYIHGVYDMLVEQQLFGTADSSLTNLKTVISHPQALGQCAEYIAEKGLETEDAVNTAVAAEIVKQKGDKSLAAICSLEAGNACGLKLLDRKINKDSANTTRFAVFSRAPFERIEEKHSFIMLFTVKDEAGSLGKAVSVLGESGCNLKALKSRPSKDVIWNYYFFAEGESGISSADEHKMLDKLSEVCTDVRIVGSFKKDAKI